MNHKKNQHYLQTHRLIQESFLSLLASKDYQKITVREICEVAKINPSTFYAHYESIAFLLDESAGLMIQDHIRSFTDAGMEPGDFMTEKGARVVLEYIREYRLFYTAYFVNASKNRNYDEIFKPVLNYYDEIGIWKSDIQRKEFRYALHYFGAGFTEIAMMWLDGGCRESTQEMARMLHNFLPQELKEVSEHSF